VGHRAGVIVSESLGVSNPGHTVRNPVAIPSYLHTIFIAIIRSPIYPRTYM